MFQPYPTITKVCEFDILYTCRARFYALNYLDFTLLSSAKMTITKIESMTENYPEFPVINLNAVTDASKQSKSSSINDVEIVHTIPVSKACNCKSETKSIHCSGIFFSKDSFRIHGFPILPGSCMRMDR
jgi:hypothetical protein